MGKIMGKIKKNFWKIISLILIAYCLLDLFVEKNKSDELIKEQYLIHINNSIIIRDKLNEQGINNIYMDDFVFNSVLGLSLTENHFSSSNSQKLLLLLACNMKKSHINKPFHGSIYVKQSDINRKLINDLEIFLNRKCY